MTENRSPRRVLALQPSSRRLGFAVLEGRDRLVDWGVRNMTASGNNANLGAVGLLFDRYTPDLLVIEDTRAVGARRRERTVGLSDQCVRLAARTKLPCRHISRIQVLRAMVPAGRQNAQAVATEVARMFPELADRLPTERKLWMSEQYAMPMFFAAALALTILRGSGSRHGVETPS